MPDPLPEPARLSAQAFLDWHVRQTERYELVDGVPVPKHRRWDGPRMMVGAIQAHTRLSLTLYSLLRAALAGKPCRAVAADGRVVTPRGNSRYPDVAVDCGPYRPAAVDLAEPVLVAEVWSKSTHWIDTTRKLEDYKGVPAVRHVLFLSQDEVRGQLWTRDDAWTMADLEGADAAVDLAALGVTFPLGAPYDGMGL